MTRTYPEEEADRIEGPARRLYLRPINPDPVTAISPDVLARARELAAETRKDEAAKKPR